MTLTVVAQNERTSFVHLVEEPSQGRASVFYCLPLADGTRQSYRRFVEYPITAPPWSPGERPFWVDLATRPLDDSIARNPFPHLEIDAFYGSRQPRDRLIFIVDRTVTIGRPVPSTMSWGRDRSGRAYPVGPEIVYRRVQHQPQIPQSLSTDSEFLAPTQVAVRTVGNSVRAPELVVEANRDRPPFSNIPPGRAAHALRRALRGQLDVVAVESPLNNGGVLVQLFLRWRHTHTPNPPDDFQDIVIAEVELSVDNPREPAAWCYEIGDRLGNRRFPVRFSYAAANVSVKVRVRLNLADSAMRGWSPNSAFRWDWLRQFPPDTPYVDLRFRRDGPDVVPRPTRGVSNATMRLVDGQNQYAGLRIEPLEDDTVSRLAVDLLVGFTPVVGDLVDIGEFVLALGTGRDRWGDEVSSSQLFLMGVGAVAPLVSSRSLRLAGEAADVARRATRRVERVWGSAADFVGHYRPAFLRRLRSARTIRELAELAIGSASASERRFLNRLSEHVGMTGVRDVELARRMQ